MVWEWLSIGVGTWVFASFLTGVLFTRVVTLSRYENPASDLIERYGRGLVSPEAAKRSVDRHSSGEQVQSFVQAD